MAMKTQQLAPGFVQQVQVQDSSCVARGKAWKSPCKACPNGPTESEEIQLTVDVQPGMQDGDRIQFDQVADEAVGHIAGDLIFIIKQIPDTRFTRQGSNLHMTHRISLLESLVGFKTSFKHLDGHEVTIVKSDVTYCSQVYIVKNEGMPIKGSKSSKRGDLYVTLEIDFPKTFSDDQKSALKKIMT